jgi:hypothetical protein
MIGLILLARELVREVQVPVWLGFSTTSSRLTSSVEEADSAARITGDIRRPTMADPFVAVMGRNQRSVAGGQTSNIREGS